MYYRSQWGEFAVVVGRHHRPSVTTDRLTRRSGRRYLLSGARLGEGEDCDVRALDYDGHECAHREILE